MSLLICVNFLNMLNSSNILMYALTRTRALINYIYIYHQRARQAVEATQ